MPELKIHLPDELAKRFRKTAMAVHGYGRGSISKAAVEALAKWCTDHDTPSSPPVQVGNDEAPTRSTPPEKKSPRANLVEQDPGLADETINEPSPDHDQPTAAS